jgi:hypothetical protein
VETAAINGSMRKFYFCCKRNFQRYSSLLMDDLGKYFAQGVSQLLNDKHT